MADETTPNSQQSGGDQPSQDSTSSSWNSNPYSSGDADKRNDSDAQQADSGNRDDGNALGSYDECVVGWGRLVVLERPVELVVALWQRERFVAVQPGRLVVELALRAKRRHAGLVVRLKRQLVELTVWLGQLIVLRLE